MAQLIINLISSFGTDRDACVPSAAFILNLKYGRLPLVCRWRRPQMFDRLGFILTLAFPQRPPSTRPSTCLSTRPPVRPPPGTLIAGTAGTEACDEASLKFTTSNLRHMDSPNGARRLANAISFLINRINSAMLNHNGGHKNS